MISTDPRTERALRDIGHIGATSPVRAPRASSALVLPLARVTGWSPLGTSESRWLYSLRRIGISVSYELVDLDASDFATLPTPPDDAGDPAINVRELTNINQGTGVQGDGINQLSDENNTYPSGFQLEPLGSGADGVPANSVVVVYWRGCLTNGQPVWMCCEPNPHNGTC